LFLVYPWFGSHAHATQVNGTADLQRHVEALEEAVRTGVTDALPACRSSCRKAYWAFNEHWPDRARQYVRSLRSRCVAPY
jgi:hypothetical protein